MLNFAWFTSYSFEYDINLQVKTLGWAIGLLAGVLVSLLLTQPKLNSISRENRISIRRWDGEWIILVLAFVSGGLYLSFNYSLQIVAIYSGIGLALVDGSWFSRYALLAWWEKKSKRRLYYYQDSKAAIYAVPEMKRAKAGIPGLET